MSYATRLKALLPDYDPAHVEAFMRATLSTLDHLSPEEFHREARTAAGAIDECIRNGTPDLPARLAETYGLRSQLAASIAKVSM